MNDAWLGRLFVRFREKRDGKALAAVFDATARELLGVAAHLVPSLDQAEDVVQTTFQRAIEHAARFDGERSLKAWLYGILWREAAKLTRTELRTPDRDALVLRASREPADEVGAAELPAAVRSALARLASPYREVLERVVVEERSTREVAEELGRSPGTVRVQLQRGLERLRRELPASLRRAAAARAPGLSGLALLRERVLEHAGCAPAAVPAASAVFLAWQLATVALTPPALLAAAAVAAAGVGVARFADAGRPVATEAEVAILEPRRASGAARAEVELAEVPSSPSSSVEAPSPRAPAREPLSAAKAVTAVVPAAQVTGIVVDSTGRPLASVTVRAEAENHYGYAETTTGADGRFGFGELVPGRWYFHVDDERYARMPWQAHGVRIDEDGIAMDGEELAAGLELVLFPPHAVEGLVVDARGVPTAGTKVALAVEQEPTEELALTDCNEEGLFRFERLAPVRYQVTPRGTGGVRYAPETVELDRDDVRGLVLRPGQLCLRGRILCGGEPVTDARVFARSIRSASGFSAEGATTAAGEYEIAGLTPGSYEILVRADDGFGHCLEATLASDERLDLELPRGRIEGRLTGIDLAHQDEGFRVMVFPYGWYQEAGNRGVFVEPDPAGRFAVRHVAPGDYAVSTWRAKERVASRVVTVREGDAAVEVELAPLAERGTLAGRVRSAAGLRGRPSIAVLAREPQGLRRTAYCEVGADGEFAEEVEPGSYALLVSDFEAAQPFVLVPDVSVRAGEVTDLALALPESRPVSVRLDAGSAWTPRSIWHLVLPGGERLSYLLLIGSDAEGRRAGPRVFRLPLGTYRIEADFGDAAPVVHELPVVPGDGVQEVVVKRP